MTLRRDIAIITCALFITLFFAIYILSTNQILNSFTKLEEDIALKNVNRSLNILNNEILKLDAICYDWAAWDDTYEFVTDLNEEYIESNLVNSTFTGLKLNFMIFVNISGSMIYAKAFDLENNTVVPLPEGLRTHIKYLPSFNENASDLGNLSKHGLIDINGKPAIISSRPILTSNDEGPIRGALIIGRFLNQAKIARLSETVGLKISLLKYNDSLNFLENTIIGVKPLSEGKIVGYALLKDVYGKPAYVLKTDMSRNIYLYGVKTVRYFIFTIVLVGVLFSVAIILFIDRSVLSRISLLSETVSKIRKSRNLKERVPVKGNDEIAKLSTEINEMLDKIESYYQRILKLNEQLRVLNRILRHDMLNNLTVVKSALEMMKTEEESAEVLIDYALKSVDRSVELVKDVRELESAIITETLKPINIREVINDVIKNYPEISFNVAGDCTCLADKALYSVIDNIISNAVIHSETDRIDIRIDEKGEWCEITVADYGKGILEEIKDKIFDEGFKYGKTARTGLGLYIVKKVIERYKGYIEVKDNKPKGTAFILRLRKPEAPCR